MVVVVIQWDIGEGGRYVVGNLELHFKAMFIRMSIMQSSLEGSGS